MTPPAVELGALGFDAGAHVLVRLGLADVGTGGCVVVRGTHPDLDGHLAAWCRAQGHAVLARDGEGWVVERGPAPSAHWAGAERAGGVDPAAPGAIAERPPPGWGLAARGAWIEAGGPAPAFRLDRRDEVWSDRAPRLYAQAAAAQWDPATAIEWTAPLAGGAVEAAVVQVMTFLIENEEAALVVPARFLGHVHPHFREVQQVLAVTIADEARHVDVFSRRATLAGRELALSSVGGRASLQTLVDEPDFAVSAFLLSVMGEGTFVSLLAFLERHAGADPGLRARLARAAAERHHALRTTAGLNDDVFDALVLLAGGAPVPDAVARGWDAVQALQRDMDDGRRARLARLGFTAVEAEVISALHTRNFM